MVYLGPCLYLRWILFSKSRYVFSRSLFLQKLHHRRLTGIIEAVAQTCSVKKVFLEVSLNSQKNTCARVSFLIKRPATLFKKKLWHGCFPVNFAKFLRTPFLQNTSGRLILRFGFWFSIFMRLKAEADNLMWFYRWGVAYTWPPIHINKF